MEKYSDMEKFDCYACQQKWTSNCFLQQDLVEHRVHNTPLTCAACKVAANSSEESPTTRKCNQCHRDVPLQGPPHGFSRIILRRYLEESGARSKEVMQKDYEHWTCYECQYPICKLCNKRPQYVKKVQASDAQDGRYICPKCRYPPCKVCKKKRPESSKYSVENMPNWVCEDCDWPKCTRCGTQKPRDAFNKHVLQQQRTTWVCNDCDLRKCFRCGKDKPRNAFNEKVLRLRHEEWACEDCRYPKCTKCNHQRPRELVPFKGAMYVCGDCHTCGRCGKDLYKDVWVVVSDCLWALLTRRNSTNVFRFSPAGSSLDHPAKKNKISHLFRQTIQSSIVSK